MAAPGPGASSPIHAVWAVWWISRGTLELGPWSCSQNSCHGSFSKKNHDVVSFISIYFLFAKLNSLIKNHKHRFMSRTRNRWRDTFLSFIYFVRNNFLVK
jgi:hypothetical protein